MCGGGKKAAPPPPAPKVDTTIAERGADTAADASLRPQADVSTATTGLGGEPKGTGTSSVLGG